MSGSSEQAELPEGGWWRGGGGRDWGEPLDLSPPPNLRSPLIAEPTYFLHLPGWQYPLCFLGEPSWSPWAPVQWLPVQLTVAACFYQQLSPGSM